MEGYINDESGDILVQNGDFVRGDARPDIITDVLNFMPGDDKFSPAYGCGLRLAMGGKPDVMLAGRAKVQLSRQGINVNIGIDDVELTVDYED